MKSKILSTLLILLVFVSLVGCAKPLEKNTETSKYMVSVSNKVSKEINDTSENIFEMTSELEMTSEVIEDITTESKLDKTSTNLDVVNPKEETNELQKEAMRTLDLVNEVRIENGLHKLTWSNDLKEAAEIRAKEASVCWSHTRPNGEEWWTVNEDIVYAENLAAIYMTGEDVISAWMASPTHKDNLLDKELVSCAISIFIDETGRWYWAQEFGY